MRSIHTKLIYSVAAGLLVAATLQPEAAQAQALKGKTVTILVGFSAGGGADILTRAFARHAGKFIPGNPKVIVKNMPGAGSMKALNFTYEKARPDGTTLIYAPAFFEAQVLGRRGMRFDFTKYSVVAGVLNKPFVQYIRRDVAPGGFSDPAKISSVSGVKFGGIFTTTTVDMLGHTALRLMGSNFKYITGYRGGSKVAAALRGGEVNSTIATYAGWTQQIMPQLVKTNQVTPLWYFPLKNDKNEYVRDPDITTAPSFVDVYSLANGGKRTGKAWEAMDWLLSMRGTVSAMFVGPPNMDPAALADLRTGFKAMMQDADVRADHQKVLGAASDYVSIARVKTITDSLDSVDPDTIAYWKGYFREGFKALKSKRKSKAKSK